MPYLNEDREQIRNEIRAKSPRERAEHRQYLQSNIARLQGFNRPSSEQRGQLEGARVELECTDDVIREDAIEQERRDQLLRQAATQASSGQLRTERGSHQAIGPNGAIYTVGDYSGDAFRGDPGSADRFRGGRNPWDLSEVRTFGRPIEEINAELRARAISAIEFMGSASDQIRSAGTDIVERFDDKDARLARMALLTTSPEYMRAFAKAASGRDRELDAGELRALGEVRALSLTDSAGGFLVPFQLDPTVVITANGSRNDIRQIARQVVATGNIWNGVTAGSVNWSWDAEASEVSDDSPTFAQPSIPVHKATGFVPVSIEALQDMANGAAEVARLLADGREVLEAAAFAIGSGVGQPKGIVTALAGTPSVVTATDTDVLAAADLYKLQGSLPARYRRNASWLASNNFYNRARQFDEAGGSALWTQLASDRPAQLLGKGVYEAEDMDGSITIGQPDYMAIFGDFDNFVIADRIGMTVEFIPHLFSSPASAGNFGRPTGQRGWYAYYRTGSDVLNRAGLRMLSV